MKTCYKCGELKTLDAFSVDRSRSDGRHSRCKACRRSHYLENREEVAAASKEFYLANKDRHGELSRAYYRANREQRSAKMAEWYQNNRDAVAMAGKAWRAENKPKKAANNAKQRAAQLFATPAWADKEMIAAIYEDAERVSRETGVLHHVDHVVPLNSKLVCGLHVEFNLEVITATANRKKANRFWPLMPTIAA